MAATNYYYRKIHPRDLIKEVNVGVDVARTFFEGKTTGLVFRNGDGSGEYDVEIQAAGDPRLGKEFKSIYANQNPQPGDIIQVKKVRSEYWLSLIKQTDVGYPWIVQNIDFNGDRHALITAEGPVTQAKQKLVVAEVVLRTFVLNVVRTLQQTDGLKALLQHPGGDWASFDSDNDSFFRLNGLGCIIPRMFVGCSAAALAAKSSYAKWCSDFPFDLDRTESKTWYLSNQWVDDPQSEGNDNRLRFSHFKVLVETQYPRFKIVVEVQGSTKLYKLYDQASLTEGTSHVLDATLKVFSRGRLEYAWCSDNTGGDANKPRPGYVTNKQLREFLCTESVKLQLAADAPADVRSWFKAYWNPDDSKGWLDGLSDADLQGFGPYVLYMIQPAGAPPPRPAKFSKALEAAVRTIIKPEENCFCDARVHEVLKCLGLADGAFKADFDEEDYQLAKSAQIVLKRRLKDLGAKRFIEWDATATPPAAKDDGHDPDFLTVNEFLWFVKEHFKEINNEVMKMSVTTVEHKPYDQTKGKRKSFDPQSEDDQLMLRIMASLRTKPFVILAGHSGTGKSRMVKKLAYMTCRDEALHDGSNPGNYCMIEVKPNWHDSTELLGYFSSFGADHYVTKQLVEFIMKAYEYPNVPFFVCLDEMNLAPVEQYFAEFLSALEDIHEDTAKRDEFFALNPATNTPSEVAAKEVVKYTSAQLVKPIDYKNDVSLLCPKTQKAVDWLKTHGLTIPKNLFVVGTVNMDESTNQFSRKVLDRAFTIEMTDARFEDFGDTAKDPAPTFVSQEDIDHDQIDALLMGGKQAGRLTAKDPADATSEEGQLEKMNALKGVLAGTPFVVAYRFANEYALYEDALNILNDIDDGASEDDKKKRKTENAKRAFDEVVLMKLLPRIAGESQAVKEIFNGRAAKGDKAAKDGLLKYLPYKKDGAGEDTASGLKMKEILGRGDQPYLTFWP